MRTYSVEQRSTAVKFVLLAYLVVLNVGCGSSNSSSGSATGTNSFPDPYAGYQHESPEHGYWHHVRNADAPEDAYIGELHLHKDGFSVTWHPFETYKDYWGTYTFNDATAEVVFSIDNGNHVPSDFQGSGRLILDSPDRLRLVGVWLGSPRSGSVAIESEVVFERFHPTETD
ncbi:hypothetical protein OT109_07980 [Phycisphaeraceae bacterium D3-23]